MNTHTRIRPRLAGARTFRGPDRHDRVRLDRQGHPAADRAAYRLRPLQARRDRARRRAIGSCWTSARSASSMPALTKENYRDLLTPLLTGGPGRGMMREPVGRHLLGRPDGVRQDLDAFYIDTVVEPWPGLYTDRSLSPSARSNYALRESVLELRRRRPGGITAVSCCGANPGMVSWMVKQALLDVAARSRHRGRRAAHPRRLGAAHAARRRQGHPHRRARHPARARAQAARRPSSTPGRSKASSPKACSRPSSAGARTRRRCRRAATVTISAAMRRSI